MIYVWVILIYFMLLYWMWQTPKPLKVGIINMANLTEEENSSPILEQFISGKSKDNIVFLEESAFLKVNAQEITDYTREFKTFYKEQVKA